MGITARGVGLLAGAVALLTAGSVGRYPELAMVGGTALIVVGLAAGYAGWRPRLRVDRLIEPDRVVRGEPSRVTLTVHNTSRLRSATMTAYDRCGGRPVPVPVLRLRPGHDTTVTYPVPTERRGVVRVGPLRLNRRDPFGLVSLGRIQGGVGQVWVYPRSHLLAAVPAGIARSLDGRIDRVPHGSITFDTLREYVIGDELRHVHWRTTARVGELMVREHVDTSLPRLVLLVDDRAAGYADPEVFESVCEAAASIVSAALRADLPLALRLVSGAMPGGDGRRISGSAGPAGSGGARDYLDLLAEATLSAADLGAVLAELRHRPGGDTLIYLTGTAGPDDLGAVSALRSRYPSVVVGVLGQTTPAPGAPGVLVLTATDGADFAAAWDGVRTW